VSCNTLDRSFLIYERRHPNAYVVALLDDVPARHFETGQPLLLRRGQIGTVVMTYDGTAFRSGVRRPRRTVICVAASAL